MVAAHFDVPMLFAKKALPSTLQKDAYYQTQVHSYTKNTTYQVLVSKQYLSPADRVLIIDDFLANGDAAMGLVDLVAQAGATVAGVGICVEKSFQPGRERLQAIEGRQDELLALLDQLIQFETISPPARNTLAIQTFIKAYLEEIGFEVDMWPFYEKDHLLVARKKGTDSAAYHDLILNGHVDVAPIGDASAWTHPPFQLIEVDGRLSSSKRQWVKNPVKPAPGKCWKKAIRQIMLWSTTPLP